MSTSLSSYAVGIERSVHVRTEFREGKTFFMIRQPPSSLRCPVFGSANVSPGETATRTLRSLLTGFRPVMVVLPIPRIS